MKVTFWGVRGSIPSPLVAEEIRSKLFRALKGAKPSDLRDDDTISRYIESLPMSVRGTVGGNTSCVEITENDTKIIIDAGSGLRNLGQCLLLERFGAGRGTAHLLLSHFHWDHIQGLPFFSPAYIPGNRLFIYAPRHNFRTILERQQDTDNFPVALRDFRADIRFVDLNSDNAVTIGDVKVTWIKLNHPGDSYAYRLDSPNGSVVYATDCEYEVLNEDKIEEYSRFFSACDVLIFDAMFAPGVEENRRGWGHSTAVMGVKVALKAKARKLVLYHHEPNYDDVTIERICREARESTGCLRSGALEIVTAYEGLTLTV